MIVILKVITDKFTIPDVQARANSWLGSGVREEKVFTISYAGQPSAFRFKRICNVVQSFLYIQIEEGIQLFLCSVLYRDFGDYKKGEWKRIYLGSIFAYGWE